MAIQQTKKLSDLEKRLRLLRQQVYGRKPDTKSEDRLKTDSYPITSDILYLRQDLTKIFLLASLALGVQIVLFFVFERR